MVKAIIKKVGTIEHGSVIGWHFDCSNGAPGFVSHPDGSMTFCGYTVEELRQIAEEVRRGLCR